VTIDIAAPHQRRQMIVTSSSEDDKVETRSASRAVITPVAVPGGIETRGMRQTREAVVTAQQGARTPTARAWPTVLEASNRPSVVMMWANVRRVAIARVTPSTTASTQNRSSLGQTGSERAQRFHTVNHQSQL
jgi:hypothetical protein